MRNAVIIILLLLVATAVLAQAAPPNTVAHGAEKVGAEAAHPGEDLGGPHAGPKFLGVPAWIVSCPPLIRGLWGRPRRGTAVPRRRSAPAEPHRARLDPEPEPQRGNSPR